MLRVEPITDQRLESACRFLRQQLNPAIALQTWMAAFLQPWHLEKPNNGFMLCAGEDIVGVFMANYSQQMIGGRWESFCNAHSWVVLKPHRTHSRQLLKAILQQPGFHFLITTPNPRVVAIFRRLKFPFMTKPFQFMAPRLTLLPCLPWPLCGFSRPQILDDPEEMAASLPAEEATVLRDHQVFPWLIHRVIGRPGAFCHVILKKRRWKRLPHGAILYISDPALFLKWQRPLGGYLLSRYGMVTMAVASRFLPAVPQISATIRDWQPKMFLSDTLGEGQMRNVYSELMALDQ